MAQPDTPRTQLELEVRAAEQKVRFHDQILRTAVNEVLTLDHIVVRIWSSISGKREQMLAEGLGRVQLARETLAKAKAELDAARAALDSIDRADTMRSARDRWRVMTIEQRANWLRESDLPAAQDLRQIEAELELLGARVSGFDELLQVANGLMAAISAVVRRVDLIEIDVHNRRRRSGPKVGDEEAVREAMVAVADRAAKLTKVARAVNLVGWRGLEDFDYPRLSIDEIILWICDYRRELDGRISELGAERLSLEDRKDALHRVRSRLVSAGDLEDPQEIRTGQP